MILIDVRRSKIREEWRPGAHTDGNGLIHEEAEKLKSNWARKGSLGAFLEWEVSDVGWTKL
jgi:hypothetical protein